MVAAANARMNFGVADLVPEVLTDKKVIIEVRDGIPEIVEAPDGVDVEIWDYDTEFYEDEDLHEDDEGEKYFLREG